MDKKKLELNHLSKYYLKIQNSPLSAQNVLLNTNQKSLVIYFQGTFLSVRKVPKETCAIKEILKLSYVELR